MTKLLRILTLVLLEPYMRDSIILGTSDDIFLDI